MIEEIKTTIQECKEMLTGEIIFDTPIKVKITPHSELFSIYGANVVKDTLYVMDGGGQWHEVQANQVRVEYIVNSLYQRLKGVELENV